MKFTISFLATLTGTVLSMSQTALVAADSP